jgi:hypothetical protein
MPIPRLSIGSYRKTRLYKLRWPEKNYNSLGLNKAADNQGLPISTLEEFDKIIEEFFPSSSLEEDPEGRQDDK